MEERTSGFITKEKGRICCLCIVFAVLQFIYLFIMFPYPMANDALIYKSNALDLLLRGVAGRTQYPFLYSLIQTLGFGIAKVFGNSEVWMLVINVIVKTVMLLPIYSLLRKCLEKYAFECTIVVAFTPIYFVWSRLLLAENLLCPLLIICLLYHIVKRPNGESVISVFKTFVAVMLALSLVYTKYLSIVLLPVLCLYWSWGYVEKKRRNLKKFVMMNIIYTFIATLSMVLYSVYFAKVSKSAWSFELFKTTIGLNSGGSSPGTVGYSFLVEPKWIICYFLYMILGASIPIVLMLAFGDINKLKKNKGVLLFFICISMVMCYVAARHSSLVSYNEGYKMCKLLGRYVAYFTPICVIAMFMTINTKVNKKRIPICIFAILVSIFLPYLILYKKLIWDYEDDWLDYARGWENVGFRYLGVWVCVIYCVAIIGSIYLLAKKHIKTVVVVACLCMSVHAVVAVATAEKTTSYMRDCREIHSFIESQGEHSVGIICNNNTKYNDMFGLNMYFSDNEKEWNRHNINGVYSTYSRGIKPELEYFYMLDREVSNLQLFEENNADYFAKGNKEYIFLKWEDEIFENIEKTIEAEKDEGKLILEFEASADCIMCFGNGFFPIKNIDENIRRMELEYPFMDGEEYSFIIYDFVNLEKFTYEMIW